MKTQQIVTLFWFLCFVFHFQYSQADPPSGQLCSKLVAEDGSTYDLTPLVALGEQTVDTFDPMWNMNAKFTFAICKNLTASCGFQSSSNPCGTPGDAGTCLTIPQYGLSECWGQFFPSGIQPQMEGVGVFIQYQAVAPFQYQTLIKILCNAQFTGFQSISVTQESTNNKYIVTINTIAACPITSAGLSGGAIFLIILLCLLFVYFVGGIIFNKFSRQKKGIEVIPNHEFWFSLPGLFKDGVMFVVNKTCRRTSYQKI